MKTSKKLPAPVKPAKCWMIVRPDGELSPYYFGSTKGGVIYMFECSYMGGVWPALYLQGYRCFRVAITPVAGKTKESK